jgi:hypothetical protein
MRQPHTHTQTLQQINHQLWAEREAENEKISGVTQYLMMIGANQGVQMGKHFDFIENFGSFNSNRQGPHSACQVGAADKSR